jgi:hypothetical protein
VRVGDRWLVNPTLDEVCAAAGYDCRVTGCEASSL